MFRELWLNSCERRVFLIALAIVLAAKGPALFYLINGVDAWIMSLQGLDLRQQIHLGRPGLAALVWLLRQFGFEAVRAPVISALMCSVMWAYVGTLVLRIWGLRLSVIAAAPLVAIIATHPYTAEAFTHREANIFQSLSLLVGVAGYIVAKANWKQFLLGSALIVFSLSMFQTTLSFLAVAWLLTVAIHLARRCCSAEEAEVSPIITRLDWVRLALLGFSTIAYLVVFKATSLLTGISPDKRTQLIDVSEIPQRIRELIQTVEIHLVFGSPFLPVGLAAVLLGGAMLIPVFLLLNAIKQKSQQSVLPMAGSILMVLAILGVAPFAVIGVVIPNKLLWISPRVLAQIGVFWAGVFAIGMTITWGRWNKLYVAAAWIITMSYAAITNGILVDQYRVNVRDAAMANRIMTRLEEHPDFKKVKRVAFVGYQKSMPAEFSTTYGNLNVSAFNYPWSNYTLLNEITGQQFELALPEERTQAECYCDQPDREWPSAESIKVEGPLAIICIKRPK